MHILYGVLYFVNEVVVFMFINVRGFLRLVVYSKHKTYIFFFAVFTCYSIVDHAKHVHHI